MTEPGEKLKLFAEFVVKAEFGRYLFIGVGKGNELLVQSKEIDPKFVATLAYGIETNGDIAAAVNGVIEALKWAQQAIGQRKTLN
ncbi:MAG: hypothetical protein JSU72_14700 [Deltaproteobacteria bacterium]|nr:MAG: hypothetical protein JSU72_14700 [Deltaproteobacteria bacterium]